MTNYCKFVLVLIMIINFTIDKDEKNLIESYILLFDKKKIPVQHGSEKLIHIMSRNIRR